MNWYKTGYLSSWIGSEQILCLDILDLLDLVTPSFYARSDI